MNKTGLKWIKRNVAVATALIGLGGFTIALAGDRHAPPVRYDGLINDYTPSAAVVGGGPYEMRGKWSLEVDEERGTAAFSASMNMETSDYGISQGSVDKDNPTTRGAHTHHINMTDGVVSRDWTTSCATFKPPVTQGFVVTGTAYVTGNGGPAPFGNPSPLTICVLGGQNVTYSNMTLAFGSPASGHFGTQAIHGVVVRCVGPRERELDECTLDE